MSQIKELNQINNKATITDGLLNVLASDFVYKKPQCVKCAKANGCYGITIASNDDIVILVESDKLEKLSNDVGRLTLSKLKPFNLEFARDEFIPTYHANDDERVLVKSTEAKDSMARLFEFVEQDLIDEIYMLNGGYADALITRK